MAVDPAELTRMVRLDGEDLHVRPVRPDDAPRLAEAVARSSPEDVYFRFGGGLRRLPPELAERLTRLDYEQHMALLAEDEAGDILGVSRLVCDPGCTSAEFALMVRTDKQKHGLGGLLFEAMMDYAARRGVREVWGDVAWENVRVRRMAAERGFHLEPAADPSRVRVVKMVGPNPSDEPA